MVVDRTQNRKGFLLVVTLFAIAMATLLSVGIARRSMSVALTALQHESELQVKWGTASCQRYTLSSLNSVLNRLDPESKRHLNSNTTTLKLGGVFFEIRLDDESAKLNVNKLVERQSQTEVKSAIRQLSTLGDLRLMLRPTKKEVRLSQVEDGMESWNQVFDNLAMHYSDLPIACERITCWGGKANYWRVPDDTLRKLAGVAIGKGTSEKLIRFRDANPTTSMNSALKQVGATERQVKEFQTLFAGTSDTFGVWVVASDKITTKYSLCIQRRFANSLLRYYTFAW